MTPAEPPRFLILPDAGPEIGGGHVMRSLTLARALGVRGARCAMLADPFARALMKTFAGAEVERIAVEDHAPARLLGTACELGARFDVAVVDHFRWTEDEDQRLAGVCRAVAAIDDMADRPRAVDWLLDPTPRSASAYDRLVPPGARVFCGPGYALVRPEFIALREASLERRRAGGPVKRVLAAFGLTDFGGVTAQAAEALEAELNALQVDWVVGAQAVSRPGLEAAAQRRPGWRVRVAEPDMAGLTAAADAALGAGGSSTWERACLGAPTLTLVLADNQVPGTRALLDAGATLAVDVRTPGWRSELREAWSALTGDEALRRELSENAAALCDGRGADRAAESLIALAAQPRG